jgi:hypothetical protein
MRPYPPMPIQYQPYHFGNPGNQFNQYPIQQQQPPMYINEAPIMQQSGQALSDNSSGDETFWRSNDAPAPNSPFWDSPRVRAPQFPSTPSFSAQRQMGNKNENGNFIIWLIYNNSKTIIMASRWSPAKAAI